MNHLFVFDLDGTLIANDENVLESTINAVKKIREHGDIPILNTGRTYQLSEHIAKASGINEIICSNGTMYYNFLNKNSILHEYMPYFLVKPLIEKLIEDDVYAISVFTLESIIFYNPKGFRDPNFYLKWYGKEGFSFSIQEREEFFAKLSSSNKILKINAIVVKHDKAKGVYEELISTDLSKNFEILTSDAYQLEATILGTNKWAGLIKYANHMKIDFNEIFSFGDSENDFEMIKNSKYGVVMGNGTDHLKKIAWHVTDSNLNDGIAKAIDFIYSSKL